MKQPNTILTVVGGLLFLLVIGAASVSMVNFKRTVDKNTSKHKEEELATKRLDSAMQNMSQDFGIEMVVVDGGKFEMGNYDGGHDEHPEHSVYVKSFAMGKYEVTQEQWQAVMGTNPSEEKCEGCPVESVSWDDAQLFIDKLNERVGRRKYRLPTEAEWEYAARGGRKSLSDTYSGSSTLDSVGWYMENSADKLHKVGQKKPNELGLYDMSGNVQEWCSDWYGSYHGIDEHNPIGPSSGNFRVLRGGGLNDTTTDCTATHRSCGYPQYGFKTVGLRVVAR